MRILAIDYGQKRIGLALSDPLFITAQPSGFILNDSKALQELAKFVTENEVGEIVLGHPLSMSGRPSEMTKIVEVFAEKLQKLNVPIHLFDERLTTAAAERALIEGNVRREKRKETKDAVSASLILQDYLKFKSSSR